jgi:hypothetical protein
MTIITEKIEQRNVETIRLDVQPPAVEPRDILIGAGLVVGGALLGWVGRAAFLPYDYYQLAWLVPLVTLLIAWGNRHAR